MYACSYAIAYLLYMKRARDNRKAGALIEAPYAPAGMSQHLPHSPSHHAYHFYTFLFEP